jgi:hypothetical protein
VSIRKEFQVHMLNDQGKTKAESIALAFSGLITQLEQHGLGPSREWSLVLTKLEEACFFAKRAMAQRPENQEG